MRICQGFEQKSMKVYRKITMRMRGRCEEQEAEERRDEGWEKRT